MGPIDPLDDNSEEGEIPPTRDVTVPPTTPPYNENDNDDDDIDDEV